MGDPRRPQFGERAAYGPGDVCYRHKTVPSFTLCQRCGNTICGDCQISSAVGVLCPDCVRQSAPAFSKRAARAGRATGRRLADPDKPVITYSIMAVCALVFIAQVISSRFGGDDITRALWYAPAYSLPYELYVFPGGEGALLGQFEPWRMLTAMFTHSTGFLFHILFNLYALWLFGRNLERILGRWTFLGLYLLSGLGGSLGVMLWSYADPSSILVPTVGASGAIFGVLLATLLAYRARQISVTSLAVLIAINLAIGFIPGSSISWQAHLGGSIAGAIAMALVLAAGRTRSRRRIALFLTGFAAVLVLLSGLFVVLPPIPVAG